MESRKGDARRDPLEGEPEQSYGTREEFHVVIPQAFPEHLLCDLYWIVRKTDESPDSAIPP